MKIIKDNVVKEVSEKAAKIAIGMMGWSEVTEIKRPSEVGTKTKPPIIIADQPVKLRETAYPGDITPPEIKTKTVRPTPTVEVIEPTVKKTRKPAVKSKSSK